LPLDFGRQTSRQTKRVYAAENFISPSTQRGGLGRSAGFLWHNIHAYSVSKHQHGREQSAISEIKRLLYLADCLWRHAVPEQNQSPIGIVLA
tara:strand:+ start:266 stop:541 length:276 start_codon:yes stop_codon:yes gene_type:complete